MEFDIIKSANNVENVLCTIESDTEDSAIEIAQEKALYYIRQHAPIYAEDQWVIRFDGVETIIQNDGEEIIFKVEECDNAEDLMYAIVQQGSDPYMIENIKQAKEWLDEIHKAQNSGDFNADDCDPDEWDTYCKQLGLEPKQVKRIHWFCGKNAGTYVLLRDY